MLLFIIICLCYLFQNDLEVMILTFESITSGISPLLLPLMKPFVARVEEKIGAGLTVINWNSLNIEKFMQDVYQSMDELKLIIKRVYVLIWWGSNRIIFYFDIYEQQ